MSVYSLDDERKIRVGRLVRDWTKSGLLSEEQRDRIVPELQVELRRTNVFLRVVLFIFALLILQSTLGIVALTVISSESAAAVVFVILSVVTFWLAGVIVDRFKFYRFGIEEAVAVTAVLLMGAGAAIGWSAAGHSNFETMLAIALVAGAAAALAVFARFGYLYAAITAMAAVAALPFLFGDSEMVHRVVAVAILAVFAATAWTQRSEYGAEHPGDTYASIEAVAWIGIYALVNLQLFTTVDRSEPFYWATYAGIWILPLLGLWLSIRSRHRMLLDASVLMLLATLISNKAYLGTPQYAWDPIVFGLLLMGSAIGIRRWLASGENGERHGFTATRILVSDRAKVGLVGMAGLAHQPSAPAQPSSAPPDPMGGGRSGGGGAGGSF